MFVRNIDLALQRAEESYSPEVWQAMTASERSAAIYRELQAMEARSINEGATSRRGRSADAWSIATLCSSDRFRPSRRVICYGAGSFWRRSKYCA
jgi:hypothetical protein